MGLKRVYLHYDGELVDCFRFIAIDGIASVREVYRFPAGPWRIENGIVSFECAVKNILVLSIVINKIELMD